MAPDDLDESRKLLYDPARLKHRLFLLEHVVLPSLRHQSDQDFTLVLVMGDNLPKATRKKVLQLIGDIPQIHPVFVEEGGQSKTVFRDAINALKDADAVATAQFRLDDDDAVGVDFVKLTREIFEMTRPMFEKSGIFGLDYSRGFVMKTMDAGCEFIPISIRLWAPGMVVFSSSKRKKCVLDYHHLRLWHYMPTLMWNDRPMFIRGAHHSNDSDIKNLGRRSRAFKFQMSNLKKYMRENFAIDVETIERIWNEQKSEFIGK